MKLPVQQSLDARDALQILKDILFRRLGYLPEWLPAEKGPDMALLQIVARYLETILRRLNQAPEKNKLAFLDLTGIDLIPAQAARAPIVFRLSPQVVDTRAPAGTRVVAPPPPDSTQQIIFETERSAGLSTAQLTQVVSLWPGRDQYIDHSSALLAGQPFQLFNKSQLQYTPHILYLAHDKILALAGKVTLDVEFELSLPSAEPLDTLWEYWDGQVWRGFKAMHPICQEIAERKMDGTEGFTRSGRFRLQTDCAESAKTTVNGIEAFWIRGRLTEPLLKDPIKTLPEVERIRLSNVIQRPLSEERDQDGNLTGVRVGLLPDKAFATGTELDLTKPFFPYGHQPQPGDAFYFSSEEIFSKPGARVEIGAIRSQSPLDSMGPGLPRNIALSIDPEQAFVVNSYNKEPDTIRITATVADTEENDVPDRTEVTFTTTDVGIFVGGEGRTFKTSTVGGTAEAVLSSDTEGQTRIVVSSGGVARTSEPVRFIDRMMSIVPSKTNILANGTDASLIEATATALDEKSPLAAIDVTFHALSGTFHAAGQSGRPLTVKTNGDGIASASYTNDVADLDGIEVWVESGLAPSSSEVKKIFIYPIIELIPLPKDTVPAKSNINLQARLQDHKGVGVVTEVTFTITSELGRFTDTDSKKTTKSTDNGIAVATVTSDFAGEVDVESKYKFDGIEDSDSVRLFFQPGIESISLRPGANVKPDSEVTINVAFLDSNGDSPSPGTKVRFTTNLGGFTDRGAGNDGKILDTVTEKEKETVSAHLKYDGEGVATVTVSATIDNIFVTHAVSVHFEEFIQVRTDPDPPIATPNRTIELKARILDQDKIPLQNTLTKFTTDFAKFANEGASPDGKTFETTTDGYGTANVIVECDQKDEAKISITVNALSVSATVPVGFTGGMLAFANTPMASRISPQSTARENAATTQQTVSRTTSTIISLSAEVEWEFWNGREWTLIPTFEVEEGKKDLNLSSKIRFEVPPNMEKTKVNGQEGLWVRLRLKKGTFGLLQRVKFADQQGNINAFEFVTTQPPVLSDFRLGYTWQYGPFHPEHVFAHNDFQYQDHTEAARLPGMSFLPFRPASDVTPSLYLGFDKKLPVDRINLYFDILEQLEKIEMPALLWEYWNSNIWHQLSVEDETADLRTPGMLSFIAGEDSKELARFDAKLHWLRGRLKEDGPPGQSEVNAIYPNAVWAAQQQTVTDDPLGTSTGQPDQIFLFRQIPILEGERIEVRELSGNRANVEWRILAMEIFGGDARVIRELEELLGKEGSQTDIEKGDLRLLRDRNKRVTEVWVRWQNRKHLYLSGANDRHYVLERARGRLILGDGERGKVPPPGAAIVAKQYRTGGGSVGNVAARSITQLLAGIGGVETIFNPKPGEGGTNAETLEALSLRGPQTLRHRGNALLPQDYETLAKEASPAVAMARAIPCRHPGKRHIPGWVTVIIIPHSEESRPCPSFGLRQQVQRFLETRATADLAAANHVHVTGPDYFPVDVHATVASVDAAEAGAVEKRALATLAEFFHPLRGGPEGQGWELGRDVFLSDVAAVLERVAGVDFVKELTLLLGGVPQGERIAVADDRVVVAGEFRLKMI